MNATPRKNPSAHTDDLGARLRRESERAFRAPPSGLRARVVREIISSGRPPRAVHRPSWRSPVWGAAALATAASIIVLIGASLTPSHAPIMPEVAPGPLTRDHSTLAMLYQWSEGALSAPERIFEETLSGEMTRLREDAGRATRTLQAAWKPIRTILTTQ